VDEEREDGLGLRLSDEKGQRVTPSTSPIRVGDLVTIRVARLPYSSPPVGLVTLVSYVDNYPESPYIDGKNIYSVMLGGDLAGYLAGQTIFLYENEIFLMAQ
jgi:hypothetical protein